MERRMTDAGFAAVFWGGRPAEGAGGFPRRDICSPTDPYQGLFALLLARGDMAANLAPRRRPVPLGAVPSWS
jgi:hypothetical protein